MTITPTARTGHVSVPPRSARVRGSILDIADVHEGLPWGDGEGMIDSFNCIGIDVDAIDCAGFKGLTKRFDPPSYGDSHLFNVQGGVTCKGPGFDMNDSRVKAAFDILEAEGVSIGVNNAVLDSATDLTPGGTGVTPAQALGILEGAGYAHYAGSPIIHVGPGLASQWAATQAIEFSGNSIRTRLGTPVAVSNGNEELTGGKLAADQWGYVTGHMVLWRSEAVHAAELDRSTNDMTVLYERLYMVAIDCLAAKVKVKVL